MGISDKAKSVAGATAKGAKIATGAVVGGTKAITVGYGKGLTYPFKGMKFVFFEHPGLIRYWIFPILITGVFIASVMWGGWVSYEGVTNAIWEDPTAETYELHKRWPTLEELGDKAKPVDRDKRLTDGGPDWLDETGHWVHATFGILILLLIWTLGIVAAVFLTNVFAAPFNDLLSEEVERLRTGREGPPFTMQVLIRDSVRTVGLEVIKLGIYAIVMIPLFILSNVFPAVGHVVYSIFGFLFTAIYFAVDYIDWPASRRNRSTTYRFGLVTEHFMPMFGFGTGVWLFLFIPLLNLLFMPAAVAGGTLLFLDLEGEKAPAD